MKIRNGFVSNSSSSSFIIDGNKYTCADIAKHVSKVMYLNNDSDILDKDLYKQICKNLDNLKDKNIPMYIECYDDIKICKKKNKIYVEASS